MSIEDLWRQLAAAAGGGAQTRVDAAHPLDIYADLQPPDRVGLVAVCGARPPEVRPMRALSVEHGRRADGRWTLRLALLERQLLPVFAALCRDVVACTRSGVDEARLGQVVVQRILHWRSLLEREAAGLGEAALRGLIGELLVLRDRLLPALGPGAAIPAWRGPLGAPQDFVLPDGRRIEVKTVGPHADQVRINGLHQLDPCGDPLTLTVVRAEAATPDARGAVSAPALIGELRGLLAAEPEALAAFETALSGLGWHDHASHDAVALRVVDMEDHEVGPGFPRLTRGSVPAGLLDADYAVALPGRGAAGGKEGT
ncbi:PD-(D/E)XK motif protein [Roseomonas mucosa]|uniref:PD-(D/E)XK motif protein n=1 Tax=Roseomonas mucosa TaxID=207340 RepID=UPI0028CC4E97|nr:PD-(D/E)XK motif protein [Roseomonas mucosa]MDT8278133.1 PD-(D/E)XK motif protein [Roseomonas mucosa]